MNISNPYLLLTPGPLSTSPTVKEVMMMDWCTWDDDYNQIVQQIRSELLKIANVDSEYSVVLMQGSGTFCVEAAIGTLVNKEDRMLILTNGAYGKRICTIADRLQLLYTEYACKETEWHNLEIIEQHLKNDPSITHVVMVHCETTTGILNQLNEIAKITTANNKVFIVDAMSSFGGIPIDLKELSINVLISSANKCIQGVPGFGFVICSTSLLQKSKGNSPSLSLDLYDQWQEMEKGNGKWRFTSPTHTVRAFQQALKELLEEGGVNERFNRYSKNHKLLVAGMQNEGFTCLLPDNMQSPFITSFLYPESQEFKFIEFYARLKEKGFVIYPGKISEAETFRIGTIGHVFPDDIEKLLEAVRNSMYWRKEEMLP